MTLSVGGKFVFISLHTTRFPTAGIHICADWPLDWSSAAKWALLLITYLTAAVRAAKGTKRGWQVFIRLHEKI